MRAIAIVVLLLAGEASAQEVRGTMSVEVIRRVVHRQGRARLRACYRTALEQTPDLEGRWLVTFVIAADGHVVNASMEPEDRRDAAFERCIAFALQAISFPSTSGGMTAVRWPFEFVRQRPATTGPPRVTTPNRGPYVVTP